MLMYFFTMIMDSIAMKVSFIKIVMHPISNPYLKCAKASGKRAQAMGYSSNCLRKLSM